MVKNEYTAEELELVKYMDANPENIDNVELEKDLIKSIIKENTLKKKIN